VPDWTIRGATQEHVAPVLALWRVAGAPPTAGESPQALSILLRTDGDALIVAEADGVVVGSLIAGWDGWRGGFYRLAVHPDRRRQGLGTALLREGERRLWGRGAARLTAIVVDEDPPALEFWRAAGYTRQEHRARFIRSAAQ
jgi:ribosomal protein S18 acetylase RimI-like enzyme